jgi:hypothetical protein
MRPQCIHLFLPRIPCLKKNTTNAPKGIFLQGIHTSTASSMHVSASHTAAVREHHLPNNDSSLCPHDKQHACLRVWQSAISRAPNTGALSYQALKTHSSHHPACKHGHGHSIFILARTRPLRWEHIGNSVLFSKTRVLSVFSVLKYKWCIPTRLRSSRCVRIRVWPYVSQTYYIRMCAHSIIFSQVLSMLYQRIITPCLYSMFQLGHACKTLAMMYLQRGPPTAENKPTTHRTQTHRTYISALCYISGKQNNCNYESTKEKSRKSWQSDTVIQNTERHQVYSLCTYTHKYNFYYKSKTEKTGKYLQS